MYLSHSKVQTLSELMQTFAEPHSEEEVRRKVGTLFLKLLDADFYASYVWCDTEQAFGGRVAINMEDRNLQTYENHYQHCDPITPAMQKCHKPTLVNEIMAQDDLIKTEFFNDFLYRDGLYWGVNLFAWIDDENVGDVRIWRSRKRENFDLNTLELLELIRPAFTAALSRARRQSPDRISLGAIAGKPACVTDAPWLGHVATGRLEGKHLEAVLSKRELDVVRLVALGWSDKAVARKLDIAFTTVRTHMTSAFRKLGVDNRVQLASLWARKRGHTTAD